jgi:hypothetical protein
MTRTVTGMIGWLLTLATASCVGAIGETESDGQGGPPGQGGVLPPISASEPIVRTGVRRLSVTELRNTMLDLVGVDPNAFLYGWPADPKPFDNNTLSQIPSEVLIEAMSTVADSVARLVANDPALRAKAFGQRATACAPTSPTDSVCLEAFIKAFGRRALRRPLDADEVVALRDAASVKVGDFPAQVEMIIRVLLQDAEFLYRVECGGCTAGAGPVALLDENTPVRLGSFELASRLSYLLWGSMPDDAMLDLAAKGGLASAASIRQQAIKMMASKRARDRVMAFHGMWLGYTSAPLSLPASMIEETSKLLERVIFEKKAPWLDLFTSTETYLDGALAAHYGNGMPKPAGTAPGWVGYGATGRQGILSHASFLSVGNGVADSSPTLRGKYIRNQLLCEDIPEPMNVTLNGKPVDTSKPLPVEEGDCRIAHIQRVQLGNPGCAGCHTQMDPIGFGLENYDMNGAYRDKESERPACPIDGLGKLGVTEGGNPVLKDFRGPAGLSNLLTQGEARAKLTRCLTKQFFQFAVGRETAVTRTVLEEVDDRAIPEQERDAKVIAAMSAGFATGGFSFEELLLSYVTSTPFTTRLPHALGEGR